MYNLSKNLISSLAESKIYYCHWKSNLLLNEALAGYDDLDILVAKKDIASFENCIFNLGFKEASNSKMSLSAVKHYYGLDKHSGNMLHLHVYYQIKTGPSWIKSYRFDFEDYIFRNLTIHETGMPIPKSYIELVIFVFRVLLKHTKFNEFFLINHESIRTKKELEFLLKKVDKDQLIHFLKLYFSEISISEFYEYINIIQTGSSFSKFRHAFKLKRQIKKYHIYFSWQETYKNFYQLTYRIFNKVYLKEKKILHNGGALMAVVGLDATGKTSVTSDLKTFLGKNFTVSLRHFGKPKSRFLTLPVNLVINLVKRFIKSSDSMAIKKNDVPRSMVYLTRQLILAYDRFFLIKACWNRVAAGEIVILDRYYSNNFGVMDSRRLDPNIYKGLKKKIALIENRLYDRMPSPDLLIHLTVPVDIAVSRNESRIKFGKEDEAGLRLRHEKNKELNYSAKVKHTICTNRPYNDVIHDIKEAVWLNL